VEAPPWWGLGTGTDGDMGPPGGEREEVRMSGTTVRTGHGKRYR